MAANEAGMVGQWSIALRSVLGHRFSAVCLVESIRMYCLSLHTIARSELLAPRLANLDAVSPGFSLMVLRSSGMPFLRGMTVLMTLNFSAGSGRYKSGLLNAQLRAML